MSEKDVFPSQQQFSSIREKWKKLEEDEQSSATPQGTIQKMNTQKKYFPTLLKTAKKAISEKNDFTFTFEKEKGKN